MSNIVRSAWLRVVLWVLIALPAASAAAQTDSTAQEARVQEIRAAWQAASDAAVRGPAAVALLDEAHLRPNRRNSARPT